MQFLLNPFHTDLLGDFEFRDDPVFLGSGLQVSLVLLQLLQSEGQVLEGDVLEEKGFSEPCLAWPLEEDSEFLDPLLILLRLLVVVGMGLNELFYRPDGFDRGVYFFEQLIQLFDCLLTDGCSFYFSV